MQNVKIVTHNGVAHADEILAIAALMVALPRSGSWDVEFDIQRLPQGAEGMADLERLAELASAESPLFAVDYGRRRETDFAEDGRPQVVYLDHHQDRSLKASNILALNWLTNLDYISERQYELISRWFANEVSAHDTGAVRPTADGKSGGALNAVLGLLANAPTDARFTGEGGYAGTLADLMGSLDGAWAYSHAWGFALRVACAMTIAALDQASADEALEATLATACEHCATEGADRVYYMGPFIKEWRDVVRSRGLLAQVTPNLQEQGKFSVTVAADDLMIDPASLPEGAKLIGNGFMAVVGSQAEAYAVKVVRRA